MCAQADDASSASPAEEQGITLEQNKTLEQDPLKQTLESVIRKVNLKQWESILEEFKTLDQTVLHSQFKAGDVQARAIYKFVLRSQFNTGGINAAQNLFEVSVLCIPDTLKHNHI